MPERLIWRRITLGRPVSPEQARAVLSGLATVQGQPRIVLEAHARAHKVAWRIGAAEPDLPKVRAVLHAHLPGVQLVPAGSLFDADSFSEAATLTVAHSRTLPLRADPVTLDHVSRQLFGVFAGTGKHEVVRVQLILGPRLRPRRGPAIDGASRTQVEAKHGTYGFGCALRIASRSGHHARARQLITNVAAAFRVIEVPGLTLGLRCQGRRAVHEARSPFFWPLWLSVDDLVPLMGWPVLANASEELPGLPPRHPRLLTATTAHPTEGRPVGYALDATGVPSPGIIGQLEDDALRHTHVLGLNGTGKSTLLARLILHDLSEGRGAVVIDPKGDLIDDLLARIPKNRLADLVVLDARHPGAVGINPLRSSNPDYAADSVLSVFHDLFTDSWGPRTADILHAAVLTLARHGDTSLIMLPLLLTQPKLRRQIVPPLAAADPLGLGTFWATYESWSEEQRAQAIQPLMNKLRSVLLRPALREIFGQPNPAFDLADVFTDNKVLLVALGKGVIGVEGARLLGSLVTTQVWHTILARISTPPAGRTSVNIYIDEVQDYIAGLGDLGDALATARGYGAGFTIAHQELGQLGRHRPAVLANARSRIVFQPSPADARELAASFGGGALLEREDFRALASFHGYAQLLVNNATTPWVSFASPPLGKPRRNPAAVRRASATRYGGTLPDDLDLNTNTQAHQDAPCNASSHGETFGRRRTRGAGDESGNEGRS